MRCLSDFLRRETERVREGDERRPAIRFREGCGLRDDVDVGESDKRVHEKADEFRLDHKMEVTRLLCSAFNKSCKADGVSQTLICIDIDRFATFTLPFCIRQVKIRLELVRKP